MFQGLTPLEQGVIGDYDLSRRNLLLELWLWLLLHRQFKLVSNLIIFTVLCNIYHTGNILITIHTLNWAIIFKIQLAWITFELSIFSILRLFLLVLLYSNHGWTNWFSIVLISSLIPWVIPQAVGASITQRNLRIVHLAALVWGMPLAGESLLYLLLFFLKLFNFLLHILVVIGHSRLILL